MHQRPKPLSGRPPSPTSGPSPSVTEALVRRVGCDHGGLLTLRPGQCRHDNAPIPLAEASLSA
jgi:hypothetical protein